MSAPSPQGFSGSATIGVTPARYAQLIYTSFNDGSGSGGGWQVKAQAGDLTAAECQELTARVVARFDVGDPLPTYPTPDEIAGRPARLVYATLDGDTAGYWHTVDAGMDATGRPGNVMAHVLFDRSITTPTALRPIQLWGSPQWLRPYGAAEVAAATLNEKTVPEPTPQIGAASVISFLTGTTIDRQSVFRVLLDAVYAAMAGGPGVMLITGDLDSGPRWIAAVSFFMSPGTARRFSWSTHDDPALAAADLSRGIHLVVVARARVADAPDGEWIAIDEFSEPGIGQLGSTHQTASGAITVTGWSVLAEGVLADELLATRLLAQQDRIAAEIGDQGLTPVWPLAVAVRRDDELSEFHIDADQVIADDAPRHADNVEWIAATVAAAAAATAPANSADAYERFLQARQRRTGVAAAAQRLLHNVLNDPEWILGGQLAELPNEPVADLEPLQPAVAAALETATEWGSTDPVQGLRAQLRIAELLTRLCCADTHLKRAAGSISALISPAALGALADSVAARPLLDDAAISVATRERVLRPVIARRPAHFLDSFGDTVWGWLFGEDATVPAIPANPNPYDCVLLPRYIARVLDHPEKRALTAESAAELALDAMYLALGADELPDHECRDLITRLSGHTRLTESHLSGMFSRWPRRVRPAAAISAMYYDALPAELIDTLADAAVPYAPDRWDVCAVAAARLRALYRTRPWTAERVEQALNECAWPVFDNLPLGHIGELTDDLVAPLAVLFTVGQARGDSWCDVKRPAAQEVRRRLRAGSGDIVDLLTELAEDGIIDTDWLVSQGMMSRIKGIAETATLLSDPTDDQPGWADAVVSALVKRRAYRGPTDASGVRDSAWPLVRDLSADDAEKFFAGYQRAARDWLQANRIGQSDRLRPGFLRPS
ncbi:hypothetical protein ACGFK1_04730 [Mycobacterium sp. NPDC048908]|uniref:GAP1-N2 domain-containing protein n=1 Tax=Mycobacterium sp. NPDC048908 TaxID=3364292 RepID=UPI003712C811